MSEDQQDISNLMLGDNINYPFILGKALIAYQLATVKPLGIRSKQEILAAAELINASLPDPWTRNDEEYKKELKASIIINKIDVRPIWCGVRVGEPKFIEKKTYDPMKLYHTCINVLQRRGLIDKKVWIEKMTYTPEDFENENNEDK